MTNPDEVFNGIDKPRLVEVGPYTYRQQWHSETTMEQFYTKQGKSSRKCQVYKILVYLSVAL